MTDEELDGARAREAYRRATASESDLKNAGQVGIALHWAARLAREGWKPEDPLLFEVRQLCKAHHCIVNDGFDAILFAALKRGIEIGKEGK
jgi:hypothetical protein